MPFQPDLKTCILIYLTILSGVISKISMAKQVTMAIPQKRTPPFRVVTFHWGPPALAATSTNVVLLNGLTKKPWSLKICNYHAVS